ncbi:TPA: PRTRC system protein E [Burkholderia cenocepacia]|nr:PRTRC system protein E [Burkholderia orbicola]MDN7584176.1 PRTRC system protein E [Burkholderia orbicola]HDV6329992.1 PRTRC system protein E [Burkholderia cenocepacia]HDV6355906.1 PRTRC system protein E [Burkholderia cenocepacia]
MSLFTSLHELARTTSINILITAEGDENLRVNVTPLPNAKGKKELWPLSLVATPQELDAEFAAAVEAYEPGALSLLDQARACAAANKSDAAPALPAPNTGDTATTPGKRGRGRPPKAAKAGGAGVPPASDDTGETDPRQMTITDTDQPLDAREESPAVDGAGDPEAVREDRDGEPANADAGVDLY